MKNIENILLTGDDGYNSPGIRTLIYLLKNKFNLKIVAIKIKDISVVPCKTGFLDEDIFNKVT